MPAVQDISEEEVKLRYITPAITETAGWNRDTQVRMEYQFTDGMVLVRDGVATRGKQKKADYLLSYHDIPLAIVEAKRLSCSVGEGMQQALEYAAILDVPFVYSSNGEGFLEHDRFAERDAERELGLGEFPSPEVLWRRYCEAKGLSSDEVRMISVPYFYEVGGARPRYYQEIAINRTVEAVATGVYPGGRDRRVLLVMATGTGKTFTAFQIIHRLREAGLARRVLYLADRNILIDQTMAGDFKPFSRVMTKVSGKVMDSAFEVYMSLYQQQVAESEEDDTYREFSPEFFDLIIVDECHRGSARDDSNWRRILEYFSGAVQVGMTATPKETEEVSNIDYFGEPLYVYSLKQGIEDGFLAPYKVIRVHLDKDLYGWRPGAGRVDVYGNEIEDREFGQHDFDRELVIDARTQVVAERVWEYLESTDRYAKTIVFCESVDHAARMRQALVNVIGREASENYRYVMQITGDNAVGKRELMNFADVGSQFPVIATTSDLLTTGVNCKTCKVIVIDKNIGSLSEFKQILGRGTRLYPKMDKMFFTLLDFRDASRLFADPDFMGEPISVYEGDGVPREVRGKNGDEVVSGDRVRRYRVNDVDVQIVSEQVQYYDAGGKLTTESFTDFTRKTVRGKFATLDAFLERWNSAEKREVISGELELQGVFLERLRELAGSPDMDDFDLLCHVAFDARPLTKADRVRNVRRRGYLDRYSGVARRVLEVLLEKYMHEGDAEFVDVRVLRYPEILPLGSPQQIIRLFGGRDAFLDVLSGLRREVYSSEV